VSEQTQDTPEVANNDIVFDCPHCGKSLAIDPRGAGLIITCPDCSQPVQVPGLPLEEREGIAPSDGEDSVIDEEAEETSSPEDAGVHKDEMAAALEASHAKIARLVESLEEVRERRRYLEQLRTTNISRFKQIGKEMETIQHAMDRIVAHLQDASVENGSES
jgi:transcription elongation factor Elf1